MRRESKRIKEQIETRRDRNTNRECQVIQNEKEKKGLFESFRITSSN